MTSRSFWTIHQDPSSSCSSHSTSTLQPSFWYHTAHAWVQPMCDIRQSRCIPPCIDSVTKSPNCSVWAWPIQIPTRNQWLLNPKPSKQTKQTNQASTSQGSHCKWTKSQCWGDSCRAWSSPTKRLAKMILLIPLYVRINITPLHGIAMVHAPDLQQIFEATGNNNWKKLEIDDIDLK